MAYISSYEGKDIDNTIALVQTIFDKIYPIGSIYMSMNDTNPSILFGGTWEQIKDKFLLANGNTYAAATSGGAATHAHTSAAHSHTSAAHSHTTSEHTLTVNEIPAHRHTLVRQKWYSSDSNVANSSSGAIYGASTTTPSYYSKDSDMLTTGGGAAHSHGDTGSTTPGITGSTTPGNTGSSSNIPPYITVYVWNRIA